MKFGCCGSVEDIASIAGAGYDFVELPVAAVKPNEDDSVWTPVRRMIDKAPINPEAWNCLLPGDVKVTGPNVDLHRVRGYLETAFSRIGQVGGRVVVFGSGAARMVPDRFPMDEAKTQLREFLKIAGDIAHEHALRIAIEPLNHRESNVLNSVPEAVSYAAELNHPSVAVLADFYHMDEEQEALAHIVEAKHYLVHVHVADTGRLYPGSGVYNYPAFFSALVEAGYDKRISCECGWGDNPDTARASALAFLRDGITQAVQSASA